jgi:hypothetical protein
VALGRAIKFFDVIYHLPGAAQKQFKNSRADTRERQSYSAAGFGFGV